ncbi:MAG TPA: GFA family protein [Caulobacteraceae bacterium]|nr:GFA family protein [Caulobacteraceae bacterium]
MSGAPYTGGCLCGALRFEAAGEPAFQGYCCCADCKKASGSGFIPFMGFPASALRFTGPTAHVRSPSLRGEAVRSICPNCGSLVFGGIWGQDDEHTIYAGALDDPSRFEPTMAIFLRDKPDWVILPEGLALFETMPG